MSALRQSIQVMLDNLNAGKLGALTQDGCAYHTPNRECFCAIGCLLTAEEHDYLDANHMNEDTAVGAVFNNLADVPARLGMTLQQAQALQNWHDQWAKGDMEKDAYREMLEGLLNGSVTKIVWSPGSVKSQEIEFTL